MNQGFVKIEDDCPFRVGMFCLRLVLEFCVVVMSCGCWIDDGGGCNAPGNTTQKATMECKDGHE